MSIPNLEVFSSSSQSGDEVKDDLKTFIHQRTGSIYNEEDLWKEKPTYELTEEEKQRAEQRKENNKQAAKRSRQKKRERLCDLEVKAKQLRTQREHLLRERERLNEERARLKEVLLRHASTCPGVRECIRERLEII